MPAIRPPAQPPAGEPPTGEPPTGVRLVPVWDLPTRLFHWTVLALVVALYVTWRINWMGWHVRAGEALLALLLFRFLWGVLGTETARFSSFAASPGAALRHLRALARPGRDPSVGHNPAGGWMVFALLGLLLAEILTGLYVNNDVADQGPWTSLVPAAVANAITALHTILWNVILFAVVLHVAAILGYLLLKGENLVRPMITGRKPLPEGQRPPRLASPLLALLLLVLAVGAAAFVSYAI